MLKFNGSDSCILLSKLRFDSEKHFSLTITMYSSFSFGSKSYRPIDTEDSIEKSPLHPCNRTDKDRRRPLWRILLVILGITSIALPSGIAGFMLGRGVQYHQGTNLIGTITRSPTVERQTTNVTIAHNATSSKRN